MQSNAILAAVLVASAFVGVGFASAGTASVPAGAESSTHDAADAPAAGTADVALQQDGEIQGRNVTVSTVNLTNVTLENVYVNHLVANATRDGNEETVEYRNVSMSSVHVGNASIENLTFDTVGFDQEFSTDLLGEVGTGTDPEDTLPPEPMEGRNLSDRTITGIEFGQLEVSTASVRNVSVEPGESSTNVTDGTVTGQGVSVETASATDVTVVGWSADESDESSEPDESDE